MVKVIIAFETEYEYRFEGDIPLNFLMSKLKNIKGKEHLVDLGLHSVRGCTHGEFYINKAKVLKKEGLNMYPFGILGHGEKMEYEDEISEVRVEINNQ